MAGYSEKEKIFARQLAEDNGFWPDDPGTEVQLRSNDGITVLPSAGFIHPIWYLYLAEARRTLERVANLPADESVDG